MTRNARRRLRSDKSSNWPSKACDDRRNMFYTSVEEQVGISTTQDGSPDKAINMYRSILNFPKTAIDSSLLRSRAHFTTSRVCHPVLLSFCPTIPLRPFSNPAFDVTQKYPWPYTIQLLSSSRQIGRQRTSPRPLIMRLLLPMGIRLARSLNALRPMGHERSLARESTRT